MIVKPIVYNARACENDVSCFTLSFLRSFRFKIAGRPSLKRKTSVIATPDVRHFHPLRRAIFIKRVLFTLFFEKSF